MTKQIYLFLHCRVQKTYQKLQKLFHPRAFFPGLFLGVHDTARKTECHKNRMFRCKTSLQKVQEKNAKQRVPGAGFWAKEPRKLSFSVRNLCFHHLKA